MNSPELKLYKRVKVNSIIGIVVSSLVIILGFALMIFSKLSVGDRVYYSFLILLNTFSFVTHIKKLIWAKDKIYNYKKLDE